MIGAAFIKNKTLHQGNTQTNSMRILNNKLPIIGNPSSILPRKEETIKPINQISLTISHSNLIQKSRRSFLAPRTKQNSKLSTQNSHPVSLYEKGHNLNFQFEEIPAKITLTSLKRNLLFLQKNPLNIDGMKAKLLQIKPLLPTKNLNMEENSESTTHTRALLSREEGKEKNYLQEFNNSKGLNCFLIKGNVKSKIFKIKKMIGLKSLQNAVKKEPIITPNTYLVEKLPINESIIIEDPPKESTFSDNHLIKEAVSITSFIEKSHEILGNKVSWKQGDLIGYGSFGEVYRAMNCITGQIFAVKKIHTNKAFGIDKSYFKEIQSELNILKEIHHPHIVKYYDFEEINDNLCIYFEYMSGGNISSLLKKYGSFPEETIRLFSKQILSALSYIHSRNVIHKDIKGANILVGNSGIVKLADFGSAQQLEKSITISLKSDKNNNNISGSIPWMAPEVVRQTKYGRKSDIWSFGCTVLEMISGVPPWSQYKFDNPIAAIMKIGLSEEIPDIPKNISKDLRDFVKGCLVRDQKKRVSLQELKNHPFLNKDLD